MSHGSTVVLLWQLFAILFRQRAVQIRQNSATAVIIVAVWADAPMESSSFERAADPSHSISRHGHFSVATRK